MINRRTELRTARSFPGRREVNAKKVWVFNNTNVTPIADDCIRVLFDDECVSGSVGIRGVAIFVVLFLGRCFLLVLLPVLLFLGQNARDNLRHRE